jgi:hypothetical protein
MTLWKTANGQGEKSATRFAAHRKNSVDLYRFFQQETTFNPFVVGSTPARPTIKKLKAPRTKVWGAFSFACRTIENRDARA